MLQALRVQNFRCYEELSWEIPERGALLLGDNAQGKTSLIEAICVGLTLHSPRTSRLASLVRHGCEQFGVAVDTHSSRRRLLRQPHGLELRSDGVVVREPSRYLVGAPPVTWLGNRDLGLVSGAAELRRNYLDFLGTQWHPEYRAELLAYKRALKSRNLLLRHPHPNREMLQSYATVMAQHGERLMLLRRHLISLLEPHVTEFHARISAGQREHVSLSYEPSARSPLNRAIQDNTETDIRTGFSGVGPHRDDILLSIGGEPAAAYASEGQQRTLAVALMLAQASLLHTETGLAPIVLIDDIFGELDPLRRQALLRTLPPECQTFITATHLEWLGTLPPPLPIQRVHRAALV